MHSEENKWIIEQNTSTFNILTPSTNDQAQTFRTCKSSILINSIIVV